MGGQGGININDIIRIGKKLFTFYKKWSKKHKQQQAQQAQQQQYGGGGGGYNNNNNQSPYPPPAVGQGNAWNNNYNQSPYPQPQQQQQSHYYGAHEGKPTKKLTKFPYPSSSSVLLSYTTSTSTTTTLFQTYQLSPFSNAYRISQFSTTCSTFRRNSNSDGNETPSLFDPTSSFPRPSHQRIPLLPSLPSTDPKTSSSSSSSTSTTRPPPRQQLKISIFHLLPQFLRPSYKTLLRINDDIFVHLNSEYAEEQNYDMSNAQNAHYVELRNKAIREGDLMAKSFSDSQKAYQSGNGEQAHSLSLQGKEHQRLKDSYNDQAAEWIFNENNKVQPRGSIDLHGLYVQESIEFTERAIDNARNQGLSELRVIVGKGNHSPSHVAKLKPAITSLMSRKRLTASLDPHNQGVLIVQLQQQGVGQGSREITGGDELVRSIGQKDDGGCLIM